MADPGPSTKAGYSLRSAQRASGKAARSAEESKSAPDAKRQKREDEERKDEGDEEDGIGEDEDDNEFYANGDKKPPVYHWKIWKKLLDVGSQGGVVGYGLFFFVFPKVKPNQIKDNGQPQKGSDPLDITAAYSPQRSWDIMNRNFWPDNLKLWQRPTPWNNPTYDIGVMKYKGHVVVDAYSNPIANFRIPLTISSEVEGLRIEAWVRNDKRLGLKDIEARLWTIDNPEWTKDGPAPKKKPLYNRRTLSKRASLARVNAGIISWVTKSGRERQTSYMNDFRTPEQRARNEAIGRDLTRQEVASYIEFGLDESKDSKAPTREKRIQKIKKAAAGKDATIPGSSSEVASVGPKDPVAAASGEDDNVMDVGQDDEEADLEALFEAQASDDESEDGGSPSSSIVDPLDSRNDQPSNHQEEVHLQLALQVTRDEFFDVTRQHPVPTNPRDNYFSQWGMLQEQMRSLWAARGYHTEAPRLVARGRWTGGIADFGFAPFERGDDQESSQTQEEGA